MELTGKYRHELKYAITSADYFALRQRLRTVMKADPHVGADGCYTIRSVYFDNYRDKALREKIDGVQRREKFRIRYYNDDFSFITLEKKIKHNELCMKLDAPLTREEFRSILQKPGSWMLAHPQLLVRELCCKMKTQQLHPRVLVSLCGSRMSLMPEMCGSRLIPVSGQVCFRSRLQTERFRISARRTRRATSFWRSNTTPSCRRSSSSFCNPEIFGSRRFPNTVRAAGLAE